MSRLEARPTLPVRTRPADLGPDVRPVVCEGELLADQLLQDLPHQPPAGTRPGSESGPEWTEAPDCHAAVSARQLPASSTGDVLSIHSFPSVAPRSSPSSHPDLELWRLPWKREEGALCYVSSEHCYQKPGASWEKPEEAMKVEPNVEQEVKWTL